MEKEIDNDFVRVDIPGTKKIYEIGKLCNAQLAKVCKLLRKRKDYDADDPFAVVLNDNKLSCKIAAVLTLHGFFRILFLYRFRWRWFYYIRQYEPSQLNELLKVGIQSLPYTETLEVNSTLLQTREVLKQLTMDEAEKLFKSEDYAAMAESLRNEQQKSDAKIMHDLSEQE